MEVEIPLWVYEYAYRAWAILEPILLYALPFILLYMLIQLFMNVYQGLSEDIKDGGQHFSRERFEEMLNERDREREEDEK